MNALANLWSMMSIPMYVNSKNPSHISQQLVLHKILENKI